MCYFSVILTGNQTTNEQYAHTQYMHQMSKNVHLTPHLQYIKYELILLPVYSHIYAYIFRCLTLW
jgi:hypothetical protein